MVKRDFGRPPTSTCASLRLLRKYFGHLRPDEPVWALAPLSLPEGVRVQSGHELRVFELLNLLKWMVVDLFRSRKSLEASRWLSRLLALEVPSKKTRQTSGAHRGSAAHPRYEFSQPALGCSAHPWRAPQARHRCRPNHGREVHDQAKTPSVTRVENVPSQSRQRDSLDRFVRRADDLI